VFQSSDRNSCPQLSCSATSFLDDRWAYSVYELCPSSSPLQMRRTLSHHLPRSSLCCLEKTSSRVKMRCETPGKSDESLRHPSSHPEARPDPRIASSPSTCCERSSTGCRRSESEEGSLIGGMSGKLARFNGQPFALTSRGTSSRCNSSLQSMASSFPLKLG
jgi:hypothetical protein